MSTASYRENGTQQEEISLLDHVVKNTQQSNLYARATAQEVKKERDIRAVKRKLDMEAELSGEAFYYYWGAGKDRIEGPSIKLAMAAMRLWGNCSLEMLPIQETDDAYIFTARFIDLETGANLDRQFRQSKKWTVHGKLDQFRKEDIRFQIGQSKASRNAILNALPEFLFESAIERAKEGAATKMDEFINRVGLAKAVDAMFEKLKAEKVSEAAALAKLGVADKKAVNRDELLRLRCDLKAIQDGEVRPEEIFPDAAAESSPLNEMLNKSEGDVFDSPGLQDESSGFAPEGGADAKAIAKEKAKTQAKLKEMEEK